MSKKQLLFDVFLEADHAGLSLTNYAKDVLGISNRQLQRIVRTQGLILNGRKAHSRTKIKAGDRLKIYLPHNQQLKIVANTQANLEILYEDQWLFAVNKQAGILTYDSKGTQGLSNQVAGYYLAQGMKLTPRPVHRLDKPTSGLLLFAKDAQTQTKLNELWASKKVKRLYWALCQGRLSEPLLIEIELDQAQALTKVEPERFYETFTELKVELITGRTHQIRRHLSHLGHPLVGDKRYGTNNYPRLALHARELRFPHPWQENKEVIIHSPIPYNDFKNLLEPKS